MTRELVLLSPYSLPTHNPLMLNAEDVAVFLNGYLALWHPCALRDSTAPPQIASPYDHEQPKPGHLYAVPANPPLFLPDDWQTRVTDAGAVSFQATALRDETLANLRSSVSTPSIDYDAGPFIGLGFGYLVLTALFEAMSHLNPLSMEDFWRDVMQAVEADDEPKRLDHLRVAAQRLREAREVLYPSHIHLLDLALFDDFAEDAPLPTAAEMGSPYNLISSVHRLKEWARRVPEAFQRLQVQVRDGTAEVCSGPYWHREDALVPLESQLWNIRKGLSAYKELFGQDMAVFARKRVSGSPHLPALLNAFGIEKTVLLPWDESVVPVHSVAVVHWPAPDGSHVKALTRAPYSADSALTYFHLAHYLSKTILQDPTACLAILHNGKTESPFYRDWLELQRLSPLFGEWVTLGRFLEDVSPGEYCTSAQADQFHSDYLHELTSAHAERPISRYAERVRLRRRFDSLQAIGGLLKGISKQPIVAELLRKFVALEEDLEADDAGAAEALSLKERQLQETLRDRLLARATPATAGYLLLNPCHFTRRVGVELAGIKTPLPLPARATQREGDTAKVVVEVPAFGFSWVPCGVAAGTKVPMPRGVLAEEQTLRNEFFEAELDPQTGGIRVFRDTLGRSNRLGQQLVYGAGSIMRVKEIKVTSAGPALGEIISEGELLDLYYNNVIARFRQRYRAWLGRPLLELQIEIEPTEAPMGYPWNAYYGVRFAWRDETAPLVRAVNLMPCPTTHNRPESPDYLEIQDGFLRTAIFTGGMPFHQRHGRRMVDVLLMPEGEASRHFALALGLDLDEPMQAAMDFISPTIVMSVEKGPPHVGPTGWLFHLDASNLIVTSLSAAEDGADAVVFRIVECHGSSTSAVLRCPRDPVKATIIDERGGLIRELTTTGDSVSLQFYGSDMQRVRVEW